MGKFDSAEQVWGLYEKGVQHHNYNSLYDKTEKAYRFYEGDQWHGCESGGEHLPFYNVIRPTINYLSSMISRHNMTICYNQLDTRAGAADVCTLLNNMAAEQWEHNKMDTHCWEIIKSACIAGDAYMYFYDSKAHAQVIDNTDIYLADETSKDLQKQAYIIIRERRNVDDIKAEAAENGISDMDISTICPDEETKTVVSTSSKKEVEGSKRCDCLIVMHKVNGVVHIMRSTRTVIYAPDREISAENDGVKCAMTLYPIAGLVWGKKKGSARGTGECSLMIPNQIEINRMLYRRSVAVKLCAFGKPVFKSGSIDNPDVLQEPGTAIEVTDDQAASRVTDIVSYLNPVSMSTDAHTLAQELMDNTRSLSNAGDAATGQINPEQASGNAIIAVRDQAAIPLNEQTALYRQFVEDIALIWADLWAAYNPDGMAVQTDGGATIITPDDIRANAEFVKVDVTPTDAYSKYAQEQALQNALASQHITFEEYVASLPQDSVAPKSKFEEILRERDAQNQMLQQAYQQGYGQAQTEMMGGMQDAMPQMQTGDVR